MNNIGPQKGPSSSARIAAQTKFLQSELNKMNNTEDTVTVYEIKEILNEQLDQHIEHLKSLFKKGSNHFSEAENFAKRTIEPILIQLNDINLLANTVIVRRKLNETSK